MWGRGDRTPGVGWRDVGGRGTDLRGVGRGWGGRWEEGGGRGLVPPC